MKNLINQILLPCFTCEHLANLLQVPKNLRSQHQVPTLIGCFVVKEQVLHGLLTPRQAT